MTSGIPITLTHRAMFIPHDGQASCPETRSWNTAITDAERGSLTLYEAMHRQFLDFALKHGVSLKDAELMLMNGVSV